VLLPDALHEPVGQAWIWQNAFNAIPEHLKRPWNGNIALEITIGEDTISPISRRLRRRNKVLDQTPHTDQLNCVCLIGARPASTAIGQHEFYPRLCRLFLHEGNKEIR
jgi:hypothetical protein